MTSVTYSSTRGGQKKLDFRTVVMQGLAHDRGLFVPDSMPQVSAEELEQWRTLSYADLAVHVIGKFVHDDQVPRDKLEDIVKRSCGAFRHDEVTPLVKVGGHAVLVRMLYVSSRIYCPVPTVIQSWEIAINLKSSEF
jgi:threonine synthase